MKESYLNCLKILKNFRKKLITNKDIKRGKLYFDWISSKTEKIENETNNSYIYNNLVKFALNKYKIDHYVYSKLNNNLKQIVNNNYILINNNYVFNNQNIGANDALTIARKILFKRGNVIWVDFGFNIGNEFGGMHPAIILKSFDNELFVIPVSSKKPKEYEKIEQEYLDGKITLDDCEKQKKDVLTIIQLDKIYKYKSMIRWVDITRMRKISILRVNYKGTIGKIDGNIIEDISKKISQEF